MKDLFLYIKYGYKATSKSYYKYLNKKGIKLGNNVIFYSPWTTIIDTQRPWMIEIGNDVHITANCKILQHGYDWCVLQKKYGDVLGSSGKVKIGNNVFIGVDTTILKGVEIGDDVIIGAKSLVNKDCLKPGVYAGNPIKYIMSLDEYYKKRKELQLSEAVELINEYYSKYNKYPKKDILREYFWLFENDFDKLDDVFLDVIKLENNYNISKKRFIEDKEKMFDSYDSLLDYVKNNNK